MLFLDCKCPLKASVLHESNTSTELDKITLVLQWCHYTTSKQEQKQTAIQNWAKEEPVAHPFHKAGFQFHYKWNDLSAPSLT